MIPAPTWTLHGGHPDTGEGLRVVLLPGDWVGVGDGHTGGMQGGAWAAAGAAQAQAADNNRAATRSVLAWMMRDPKRNDLRVTQTIRGSMKGIFAAAATLVLFAGCVEGEQRGEAPDVPANGFDQVVNITATGRWVSDRLPYGRANVTVTPIQGNGSAWLVHPNDTAEDPQGAPDATFGFVLHCEWPETPYNRTYCYNSSTGSTPRPGTWRPSGWSSSYRVEQDRVVIVKCQPKVTDPEGDGMSTSTPEPCSFRIVASLVRQ